MQACVEPFEHVCLRPIANGRTAGKGTRGELKSDDLEDTSHELDRCARGAVPLEASDRDP